MSQSIHKKKFFKVAVNAPIWNPLIYSFQKTPLTSFPQRGERVIVPLGKKRTITGVVIESSSKPFEDNLQPKNPKTKNYQIKDIISIDRASPKLPEPFLKWLEWLSEYYIYPIGRVLSLSFLPVEKKKEKKNSLTSSHPYPNPTSLVSTQPSSLKLTHEQKTCLNEIQRFKGFKTHLLYGVTGSGKTEVYLSLLEKVIEKGKKSLVLVPEISLTPQLVRIFSHRFPNQVAVLHSNLTMKEKKLEWKSLLKGEKHLLIGARSALFCPLYPLGLIIVDEEHESGYKQSEKLKYHARDAAIMLAKISNCQIVLGSATPSMESWRKIKEKKYELHQMKKRVHFQTPPEIHVIDMRKEKQKRREKILNKEPLSSLPFWMSSFLFTKLKENIRKKEQSILFLNRRGTAPLSLCQNCGYTFECPNCAVHLTLHGDNQFICHYCNYTKPFNQKCPQCQSEKIKPLGLGTKRIEKDLKDLFPDVKTARADRDEISSKNKLETLIQDMEKKHNIDILIGTQMIAKGLHFPYLTLVGFVMADISFNLPDFRSSEKNFQLILQMSGRPGRSFDQKAHVVIQTFNPQHMSVVFAQKNDFEGFTEKELSHRKALNYPPYGRLASFRIQGTNFELTKKRSEDLGKRAQRIKEANPLFYSSLQILGPSPAPLTKLKNQYRFHFLIKGPNANCIHSFCHELLFQIDTRKNFKIHPQVDIDPIHML